MVERAKAPEHEINTSLLEYEELQNYNKEDDDIYKPIFLNESCETMENIKVILKHIRILVVCVCILELFIILTMKTIMNGKTKHIRVLLHI